MAKINAENSDGPNVDQIGNIQTNTTMVDFDQHEMLPGTSPDPATAKTSARRAQKVNTSHQRVQISKNQLLLRSTNETSRKTTKNPRGKRGSKSPVKDYEQLTKEEKR